MKKTWRWILLGGLLLVVVLCMGYAWIRMARTSWLEVESALTGSGSTSPAFSSESRVENARHCVRSAEDFHSSFRETSETVTGVSAGNGHRVNRSSSRTGGDEPVSIKEVLIATAEHGKVPKPAGTSGDAFSRQKESAEVTELKNKAERGDLNAQDRLGMKYWEEKAYRQAFSWFLRAAKGGYAVAQRHLGMMYENGEGIEKNIEQARQWFRAAKENGCTEASMDLHRLDRALKAQQ